MDLYLQVAVAFTAVAIFSRIAKITRNFYIPFYIFAGILTGPSVLGLVTDTEIIGLLGEIGLVFLLFYLGLEFSINKLVENRKSFIIAGITDFSINFAIGVLLGRLLGFDIYHTLILGGIIYMSSSGIVTKTLIQLKAIQDPDGEIVMGIMVFEDLVMIFFLVFVSTFKVFDEEVEWLIVGKDLTLAIVFCVLLVMIGKKYYRVIDRFLESKSEEITLLSFLALVFAVTSIGIKMGVSEALGAFFLGIAVSEGKNIEKIERTSSIFRDIFGSMFFFYFGMNVTLSSLNIPILMVILVILLAILGKFLSSILTSIFLKCNRENSLFIGTVTISRGEFSLLIASIVGREYFDFQTLSVLLIISTTLISSIGFRVIHTLCKKKGICLLPERTIE